MRREVSTSVLARKLEMRGKTNVISSVIQFAIGDAAVASSDVQGRRGQTAPARLKAIHVRSLVYHTASR